jgi:hypothetical protein
VRGLRLANGLGREFLAAGPLVLIFIILRWLRVTATVVQVLFVLSSSNRGDLALSLDSRRSGS